MLLPMPERPGSPPEDLTDPDLYAEVGLLVRLISAANASDKRLNQAQIDAVLFADP